MNSNKGLTILVITLALVAFGTLSLASQAGEKISLMATKKHPNGNPKDMKNMVGALSANIK